MYTYYTKTDDRWYTIYYCQRLRLEVEILIFYDWIRSSFILIRLTLLFVVNNIQWTWWINNDNNIVLWKINTMGHKVFTTIHNFNIVLLRLNTGVPFNNTLIDLFMFKNIWQTLKDYRRAVEAVHLVCWQSECLFLLYPYVFLHIVLLTS